MRPFLKIIALFLCPVLLFCTLVGAAMVRSGELRPTAAAVADTLSGDLQLFGLAHRDDTRIYKQAVSAALGAKLLVLGTSRSMQLRSEFFTADSFYNAGGGIAFLGQIQPFLESIPPEKQPKRLVLVLDQYFFNINWAAMDPGREGEALAYTKPRINYTTRRMFLDWFDGKYSLWQVLQTPKGVLGMSAAGRQAGFYSDGAYSYGTVVESPETSFDADFVDTLERIRLRTARFEDGDTLRPESVAALEALLAYCAQQGIAVTAFLPPYAPTIWRTLQESGRYTYMDKLLPTLQPMFAAHGFELFDYSFLPETTDAQYIDGFHGSDRVYAQICARLAEDSALLADALDQQALSALFSASGNAQTVSLQREEPSAQKP